MIYVTLGVLGCIGSERVQCSTAYLQICTHVEESYATMVLLTCRHCSPIVPKPRTPNYLLILQKDDVIPYKVLWIKELRQ